MVSISPAGAEGVGETRVIPYLSVPVCLCSCVPVCLCACVLVCLCLICDKPHASVRKYRIRH